MVGQEVKLLVQNDSRDRAELATIHKASNSVSQEARGGLLYALPRRQYMRVRAPREAWAIAGAQIYRDLGW